MQTARKQPCMSTMVMVDGHRNFAMLFVMKRPDIMQEFFSQTLIPRKTTEI